jgi:hypothetical protein
MTGIAVEDTATSVWIDPSWLSWNRHAQGSVHQPEDTAFKLYEMHQHACDRLEGNPSEFARVDAITTLRRTVGQRVKALKDIYQLRSLPTGTKPKYDLELLEYFGIIRPFMLKRLIDIRNMVEHQDTSPPPTDECLMFADLVWYFLRSTDGLVQDQLTSMMFVPPDSSYPSWDEWYPAIMLNFKAFSGPLRIVAGLSPSSSINEARANWMKIEPTEISSYIGHEPPRLLVEGSIQGTDEQMKLMYELYFRCSHFR